MSNVVAVQPEPRRSVTMEMATRFGMETRPFEQTLRATVGLGKATPEEFAAFLLVAKQYDLNPITKEIYAFPNRGGIVPIVSIDGWLKLVNSHPQFDGMEFSEAHDEKGELVSVTCRLWRKDRSKPIVVTEYLAECYRATEPWKMKHRMLRHKAMIQCARYAFGFAGVYDPDEGERIVLAQDAARTPPAPAPAQVRQPPAPPALAAPKTPPNPHAQKPEPAKPAPDADDLIAQFEAALHECKTPEEADAAYKRLIEPNQRALSDVEMDEADALLREHWAKLAPADVEP
jgi:phage recombination protein Bet